MVEAAPVRASRFGTRAESDPHHHHHIVHFVPGMALSAHPRRYLDGHLVDLGRRAAGVVGFDGGNPAATAGVAYAPADRDAARLHLHRRDHGHPGRASLAAVCGVHVGDHRQRSALWQQLSACGDRNGQPVFSRRHPDFSLLESQSLSELGVVAGPDCGAAVLRLAVTCDDPCSARSPARQPGQEPLPGQYEP